MASAINVLINVIDISICFTQEELTIQRDRTTPIEEAEKFISERKKRLEEPNKKVITIAIDCRMFSSSIGGKY